MISDFRREVNEMYVLLGSYAAYSGNYLRLGTTSGSYPKVCALELWKMGPKGCP